MEDKAVTMATLVFENTFALAMVIHSFLSRGQ
jgi:hypothetical protein